jgi:hypothetical protein
MPHLSIPSQTWIRTRRGERMSSGRPARQAARAMTHTEAEVSATRVSTADRPKTGGRCTRKKTKIWPKKRSILVRLPTTAAV